MTQRAFATIFAVVLAFAPVAGAAQEPGAGLAQPGSVGAPQTVMIPVYQTPQNAQEIRQQLHDIMRAYPPSVGEVLGRDPSLMSRADYMAPYPQLAAFLQQHPEIVRNPSFYLGQFDYYNYPREPPLPREIEALGALLAGLGGLLAGSALLGVFIWVVRSVIGHRRWLRVSRVQAEVHTKIMDRLTTNEDLLAYIQSPAGRRFLEASPIADGSDLQGRPGLPSGPILWSLMAGIVLTVLGTGFRFAAALVVTDVQPAFQIVGIIIIALGIGFLLSAILAFIVSARMGLIAARSATPSSDHA
jgi:hypothetical protein